MIAQGTETVLDEYVVNRISVHLAITKAARVLVTFSNDLDSPPEDRNMLIEHITLRAAKEERQGRLNSLNHTEASLTPAHLRTLAIDRRVWSSARRRTMASGRHRL